MTVRILQFGDEFELVNETVTEVVVPGYSDEPYLRIGPDGVWRNANSPATYLNLDRFGRVDAARRTPTPTPSRTGCRSRPSRTTSGTTTARTG